MGFFECFVLVFKKSGTIRCVQAKVSCIKNVTNMIVCSLFRSVLSSFFVLLFTLAYLTGILCLFLNALTLVEYLICVFLCV